MSSGLHSILFQKYKYIYWLFVTGLHEEKHGTAKLNCRYCKEKKSLIF